MRGSIVISCFAVFLSLIDGISATFGALPPYFEVCPQSMPDFDYCLQNAMENAVYGLGMGYAPWGIYSIDPLLISELYMDQGNGPINIQLMFRDLVITGLTLAKLSGIQYDVKNFMYSATAKVPELLLKGKYAINGNVLILPITGNGNCSLSLENVVANITLKGKELRKDNKLFMLTDRFNFDFNTTKLNMKFDNLFGGDKHLGDNMNDFLNKNWKEILGELKPSIQKVFGSAFGDIANKIFTKVPYNVIFPE